MKKEVRRETKVGGSFLSNIIHTQTKHAHTHTHYAQHNTTGAAILWGDDHHIKSII